MKYLDDEVQDIVMHKSGTTVAPRTRRPSGTGRAIQMPLVVIWPFCVKPRRVYAEVVKDKPVNLYVVWTDKTRRYLKLSEYPGIFGDALSKEKEAMALAERKVTHATHAFCNDEMHLKQYMRGFSDATCLRNHGASNEFAGLTFKLQTAYDVGWNTGRRYGPRRSDALVFGKRVGERRD